MMVESWWFAAKDSRLCMYVCSSLLVCLYVCAQGVLKGFDQTTNIILAQCHERVYHGYHEPAEDVSLGLYIIRGDNLFVFILFIFD